MASTVLQILIKK